MAIDQTVNQKSYYIQLQIPEESILEKAAGVQPLGGDIFAIRPLVQVNSHSILSQVTNWISSSFSMLPAKRSLEMLTESFVENILRKAYGDMFEQVMLQFLAQAYAQQGYVKQGFNGEVPLIDGFRPFNQTSYEPEIMPLSIVPSQPILEYRVFLMYSNHISDVFTGKVYPFIRNTHAFMDGIFSVGSPVPEYAMIPFLIDTAKQQYGDVISEKPSFGMIRETKCGDTPKKVSRQPSSYASYYPSAKPEEFSTWYFPLWEVPIVAKREMRFFLRIDSDKKKHRRFFENRLVFYSMGALFFEAYSGLLFETLLVDPYVSLEKPMPQPRVMEVSSDYFNANVKTKKRNMALDG